MPPGEVYVFGPNTPGSPNIRLLEGLAQLRPGYKDSGIGTPNTNVITGLYHAVYDNSTTTLLRATKDSIHEETAGAWVDIEGGAGLAGADTDYWSFASVEKISPGTGPSTQTMMTNGVDDLMFFDSSIAAITQPTSASNFFTAAKIVVGHLQRGLACNVIDAGGTRREQRVQRSIVGDPTDWDTAKTGAGFTDLDDDPWPIANATVVGGRLVVYKGSVSGGSVVVGTPTGFALTPYHYETLNPTSQVGLLLRRTLLHITPNLVFFVGHDGFYIHDGARGMTQIAQTLSRDILNRLNYGALDAAHAWYKSKSGEIHIAIPTGAATTPTEYWIFNLQERRTYGPYIYNDSLTAVATFAASGSVTWNTITGPTWDTMPYTSWDTIGGAASTEAAVMATNKGLVLEDDDVTFGDLGVSFTGSWVSPAITPRGQTINIGQAQRVLRPGDALTCREVLISFKERGRWAPVVEVSADGGKTFSSLSDGNTVPGDNTDRILTKVYPAEITSEWFQFRITGTEEMKLHGVVIGFDYAGLARNQ